MKNILQIALIASVILSATTTVRAELFQTLRVGVMSREIVTVNGAQFPTAELTAAIARLDKHADRVHIKLLVPLGVDRVWLNKIIDLCKKAGVTSFEVATKS